MSKVNRRKEIKEKEELRAKFQLAMNANTSMALKWLTPADSKQDIPTPANDNGFFDLPIIPNGASLSNLTLVKADKNIGDFVKGTEIKPQLKPQTKHATSKPMTALMNKMRTQSRDKIKKNPVKVSLVTTSKQESTQDDSDLENEAIRIRSVKKHTPLPFDKKKKKGRPF